jgi:hypothetical protein
LLELESEGTEVSFESLSRKTEGDAISSRLLPMLLMSESLHASNEHYAPEECVHAFRLMKVQRQIDEVRAELADAERAGDNEKLLRLSGEQTDLEQQRKALQPRTEVATTGN